MNKQINKYIYIYKEGYSIVVEMSVIVFFSISSFLLDLGYLDRCNYLPTENFTSSVHKHCQVRIQ